MKQDNSAPVLDVEKFRRYIETFNRQDEELYIGHIRKTPDGFVITEFLLQTDGSFARKCK